MSHLSRAVSCSKRNREVDPQCSCVDLRVSRPTREEMTSKSLSVNLEGAAASLSKVSESVLLGAERESSGTVAG